MTGREKQPAAAASAHDQAVAFWEHQHATVSGFDAVGCTGLGESFNRWMYRVRRRVLRRAVRPHLAELGAFSALDVGTGTGFYLDRWRELGASGLIGVDVSPTAVDRLRQSHPWARIEQMDVADDVAGELGRALDVVSAFDVLFHIPDDEAYRRAFVGFGRLVRPGGLLVFTENLMHADFASSGYQVMRAEDFILGQVHANGFSVVERIPAFVLMNNPIRSASARHKRFWQRLVAMVSKHDGLGAALGAGLFPLELLALTRTSYAPTTEVLVCRRDGRRARKAPVHGSRGARLPRVLAVGMSSSIHLTRALKTVASLGWDVRLVRALSYSNDHADLPAPVVGPPPAGHDGAPPFDERARALANEIDTWQPDLIHAHQLQYAGYLAYAARRYTAGELPPLILTSWGSDLHWFSRFPEHRRWLRALLADTAALGSECYRDLAFARSLGFRGRTLALGTPGDGFDVEALDELRVAGPVSARNAVIVKAACDWVYRGDVATAALARCAPLLSGRELIVVYPDPKRVAELRSLCDAVRATLTVLEQVPRHEVLRACGRARVVLSLAASEGWCTIGIEAAALGALPILSTGACTPELLEPGVGVLLVDCDDVVGAARAVERALVDDALVDNAAATNRGVVRTHLSSELVSARIQDAYRSVLAGVGSATA